MSRRAHGSRSRMRTGLILAGFLLLVFAGGAWAAEDKPQYGGTLIYAVADAPPSFDAHRESTYGVIHPVSPHYSLLLKFDPQNYPKIVGDLAESWTISPDHKTFSFKIHRGVKFHDGSTLTSKDIKATYDKIIAPPSGVVSSRQSFYQVIEKVETPDDNSVVFRLKRPSASFLASLASPWNYIYKADILAKDPRWYEKNIMGTGPFKFVEYVSGSHWVAKRHEDYFRKGRPYLDGYRALFIRDQSARLAALRGGRVQAEFRWFPPSARDDLVRALGEKLKVHEILGGSTNTVIFNCEQKPFNDPRVRRAMTLALNRWEGAKALEPICEVGGSVCGLQRPGAEFALTEEELTQIPGFSRNIETSRQEARRLLKESGVPEGFTFEVISRPEYEILTVWLIDQWRQIGLNVRQKGLDAGSLFKALRSGDFKAAVYYISDYMDDPDLMFLPFLSSDKNPANFGRYKDAALDDLYLKQSLAMDPAERRKLTNQFQARVMGEMAYAFPALGWAKRIILQSSRMKGWTPMPSHYLNMDLAEVWLEKE